MILESMQRTEVTITDLINYINAAQPCQLIRDIIGLPTISKRKEKRNDRN